LSKPGVQITRKLKLETIRLASLADHLHGGLAPFFFSKSDFFRNTETAGIKTSDKKLQIYPQIQKSQTWEI